MMLESFWQYSCRVYRHPSVSTACLDLQNQHGLDVNLLLFAVWHGCTRGALTDSTRDAVLAFSTQWSGGVVRRLREARTWLKGQALVFEAISMLEREGLLELREQIKALELHAEHFQQDRLEALCEAPRISLDLAAQRRATAANLRALLESAWPFSKALERDLEQLLTALFEPHLFEPHLFELPLSEPLPNA